MEVTGYAKASHFPPGLCILLFSTRDLSPPELFILSALGKPRKRVHSVTRLDEFCKASHYVSLSQWEYSLAAGLLKIFTALPASLLAHSLFCIDQVKVAELGGGDGVHLLIDLFVYLSFSFLVLGRKSSSDLDHSASDPPASSSFLPVDAWNSDLQWRSAACPKLHSDPPHC